MGSSEVDVVIVGAGAAGLAALKELDRAGKRVVCLEARDRIGGRICTVHDPMSPIPVELGAEFVHGKPPEILSIVQSASLILYDCTERAVHVHNGKPHKNEDAWLQIDEVMKALEAAVEQGREETFSEFLDKTSFSQEAKQLATSYVEGFNAARRESIGIGSIVKDARAADAIDGDRSFRLMNGYDAVPRWLVAGIAGLQHKLRLNCVVQRIRWTSKRAAVEFVSAVTGASQTITAKQAIITVPLGVLQAAPELPGALQFDPEIPEAINAARELRFGQVIRLVLRFESPVWEENENFRDAGFLLSNEKHFPTWWTALPMRTSSITGWCSGGRPDELLGLPERELVGRAIGDLARILAIRAPKLESLLVHVDSHDWHGDPFARGSYSYVPAHAMHARERLAEPVEDTLLFAGEATETNGHSATVHGAIASGRRAATQILEIK